MSQAGSSGGGWGVVAEGRRWEHLAGSDVGWEKLTFEKSFLRHIFQLRQQSSLEKKIKKNVFAAGLVSPVVKQSDSCKL